MEYATQGPTTHSPEDDCRVDAWEISGHSTQPEGQGSQFLLQFLRIPCSQEATEPEKKLLATCTCFFLKH